MIESVSIASVSAPIKKQNLPIASFPVKSNKENRVGAYTVIINEESPIGYNGELKGEIDVDYTYKGSIDLL